MMRGDETLELPQKNLSKEIKMSEVWEKIDELKLREKEIIAFRDITVDDRRLLQEIKDEIAVLKEKAKAEILKITDTQGAYSPSQNKDYSPAEIRNIIERVLTGELDIRKVPRSPIMGTTENLREKVEKLMRI